MPPEEPIWCAFCQDRPMVGRMIVMIDGTNEQVGTIDIDEGAACNMCGRSWTGAKVAEVTEAGSDDERVAVLQYEHPDYVKITDRHIREFAAEHACSQCGDHTEELPLWAADRVLRASPHLALDEEFDAICATCAENYFSDPSEESTEGSEPQE